MDLCQNEVNREQPINDKYLAQREEQQSEVDAVEEKGDGLHYNDRRNDYFNLQR